MPGRLAVASALTLAAASPVGAQGGEPSWFGVDPTEFVTRAELKLGHHHGYRHLNLLVPSSVIAFGPRFELGLKIPVLGRVTNETDGSFKRGLIDPAYGLSDLVLHAATSVLISRRLGLALGWEMEIETATRASIGQGGATYGPTLAIVHRPSEAVLHGPGASWSLGDALTDEDGGTRDENDLLLHYQVALRPSASSPWWISIQPELLLELNDGGTELKGRSQLGRALSRRLWLFAEAVFNLAGRGDHYWTDISWRVNLRHLFF